MEEKDVCDTNKDEDFIPLISLNLFDKVKEIIKSWESEYDEDKNESYVRDSLIEKLKIGLKGQKVNKEYAIGRMRLDIMVSDLIPIEIKMNLEGRKDLEQKAIGQLEEYLRKWPIIFLVLCGNISEDFLYELKKLVEDKYTSSLISYPRIIVIPKGNVSKIIGNVIEKLDDKCYAIPSVQTLDRRFQIVKGDEYKHTIEIFADDVQLEKDPDIRRFLLTKYLLMMSANMTTIILSEIEKCVKLPTQEKMEEYIDMILKTYLNNIIKEYLILLVPPKHSKFNDIKKIKISEEEIREARIMIDVILERGKAHLR